MVAFIERKKKTNLISVYKTSISWNLKSSINNRQCMYVHLEITLYINTCIDIYTTDTHTS